MRRFTAGALSIIAFLMLAGVAFGFSDVPTTNPYHAAIADLNQRGIINGYDGEHFGPTNPVLRQQFAKMIVLSLDLPASEADVCSFTDVEMSGEGSFYPDNYVAVAAANGITNGTGAGLFSPKANISRAQLVTMVVRALEKIHSGKLLVPPAGYVGTWGSFDTTHGPTAQKAEYNGLLGGLQLQKLGPWGDMTRAETAQVLHNFFKLLEVGPTTTIAPPTSTTSSTGTKVAKVSASVSNSSPEQYTEVTAYAKVTDSQGRLVPGASVSFTWKYKTVTHTMSATTDSKGVASTTRNIAGASKGYKVVISVSASGGGGSASTSTSFTPR